MPEFVRRDGDELVEGGTLDREKFKALNDDTRREIIEILAESPSYPAEIASKLGIGKQQAYYHFRELEEAGVIEKDHEEKRSGGLATFYRPSSDGYVFDLGTGGEKAFVPRTGSGVASFLEPLVEDGSLNGGIVVGSPDQHGEDQVRAKDGHLAAEIGLKLGNYARSSGSSVILDTELVRQGDFNRNMLLLGGVLTNIVTKKFNQYFPTEFSTDSFPYHRIETPESSYSDDSIGIIQRIDSPENPEKTLIMVAGVRNRGTEGAVRAFKDLEEIVAGYEGERFYRVVRGLDMDGDGEIDDYEIVE